MSDDAPRQRDDVTTCDECWRYYRDGERRILTACRAYAFEMHESTVDVVAAYLRAVHRDGHR